MDLYETLTHDMYRWAIEQYKEIFWVLAPKKLWPKTTIPIFDNFATQWQLLKANISSK